MPGRIGRRVPSVIAFAAAAVLLFAGPAGAQVTPWEIEGYGSLTLAGLAPFGSKALPPAADTAIIT